MRAHRARGALALTGALALAGLAGLAGLGALALGSTKSLPAFDTLKDYQPLIATRVYAVDGSEAFEFARERRTVMPFERIPEVMRKAVLASEDARFYEHQGVNYLAIARCAVKNVLRGHTYCGGSTITQQVVKTFLLSSERKLTRKFKEIVLAKRLEENLKKDEILYLYLNQIYFGHRRYGVEEAAQFYFGKSVTRVTVGEAAMIAGLVQSPERLSPVKHPAAAKERQKYVLRRMAEEGFITHAVADAEAAKPIVVANRTDDPPGAWYADAVRRYLDEKYGAERVETDGLVVDIAMDPALQRAAENALEAQLRAVDRRQGWRGASIHLEPAQVSAAMPLWKERLAGTQPRPGELLVWDLGRVSPDDVEPNGESAGDVKRMMRVRPLAANDLVNGLVTAVSDRAATVDLGRASGTIALADVAWARKFNPNAGTAAPRRMKDVLRPGDVVLVRALPGKVAPVELARQGKPIPLSLEQVPKVQGALVAIDPETRGLRALVGGYDFALSQFNRATQAKRQPGSAFKAFVWGAAIESRRFTPATVVYDTPDVYRDPWSGKEWKPQNFEKEEYDGPMLLAQALAHSKNTVSAKLVDTLGVESVIQFARRCGIASDLPHTLSLSLGTGEVSPLELVNAYATLAARGFAAAPQVVLRVRDRKGTVLEEHPRARPPELPAAPVEPVAQPVPAAPAGGAEAIPASTDGAGPRPAAAVPGTPPPANGVEPDVAYVLTTMLRGVTEYGTGAAARALGRPLAGKTGTAQEHRDAWFVGYGPDLVAGVWVGFDDHAPLGGRETGAAAALPAWMAFMREALARRPVTEFRAPASVQLASVDPRTGLLSTPGAMNALSVAFLPGTVPTRTASDPEPPAPQSFFQDSP